MFVAVFVAATALKTQASIVDNVTGWLVGWSDDGAGNPSYVDYISMNDINPGGGGAAYGVNIPAVDGLLSGYAWDGGLGSYVAFTNANGYLNGCPTAPCNARREGNAIRGWARIVSIADALAIGNSGGWDGWIRLDGVTINNATGQLAGHAWAGDQGWIDFSGARISICGNGNIDPGEACDAGSNNGVCPSTCGATCQLDMACPMPGVCGAADGNGYATIADVNSAGRCNVGTATNNTNWSWTCSGVNGGLPSGNCSSTQVSTGEGNYIEVAP